MSTKQLTKLNRPNSIRYNGIVYHPVDLRQAADPSATADDQAADDATLAVLELLGEAGASKEQLTKVKNEFPVDAPNKQDKSASAPAFIEISGQLYKKAGGDKAKKNYAKALQIFEKTVNGIISKLTKVSSAMKPEPFSRLAFAHKKYIEIVKGRLEHIKAGDASLPSMSFDLLSSSYKNTFGEDAFYEELKKFAPAIELIHKKQAELEGKLAEVAKKRGRKAPGSGASKLGRIMLIGALLGALFGGLGGSSSSTYSPTAPTTQMTQVAPKKQDAKKPKPGEPEYKAFEQARNAPPPG